jgi:hypothetical protein
MNSLIVFLCLAIYFTILLVFNLFRKSTFGSKNVYLDLIKPLIPSWKFYDDFEETRLFFYRFKKSENSPMSEWLPVYQTPTPKIKHLFVNPTTNIILSAHSHIGVLLSDIEDQNVIADSKDLEKHPSYKLAKNYITFYLEQKYHSLLSYQFKLAVASENAEPIEDIILSPLYLDLQKDTEASHV